MFQIHDKKRNMFMLDGKFAKKGYDWWWHSFTARNTRTGKEKAFFIEFFTINPAFGQDEPIFGQLPVNKENNIKPSYLMVKCGCWGEGAIQLNRFFGWRNVKINNTAPFSIFADDCKCSEHVLQGHVKIDENTAKNHPEYMTDAGEMSFDLEMQKDIAFNVGYGASTLFRKLKAFEMYWHAEGIKTRYKGKITLNGEEYIANFDNSYGYADKNWGSDFTSPWLWLSSCCMQSRISGKKLSDSAFEMGGGRPKVFGIALNKKLLGGLWYEGKEYEYNFSKIWQKPKVSFKSTETEKNILWHVIYENKNSKIDVRVKCKKKDMLLINYEAPNGKKLHNRLWNGGNGVGNIKLYEKIGENHKLVDDIIMTHVGCEYGEYSRK